MKYEKYKKGQNDLFSGIVLGGFAIAYLIGAAMIKIPKMLSASLLNASSVPKLWGVLLLILGIVLIVRGLRTMKSAAVLPVSCPTPLSRTAPRPLKSSAPASWTASWLLKLQTTLPSAAQ